MAGSSICSAAFYESAALRACPLPRGELSSVARLRGFKSAEPEKTEDSRLFGVNLQSFPV